MILTIALSPSIEKNIILDTFTVGESNEMSYHDFTIGDSAIYSAYMVKLFQGEPYLLGFAGGIGGRYIKYFTDKFKIKSDLLWKDRETRSTTTIIDRNQVKTTLLNKGFEYEAQDVKNFNLKFNAHLKDVYGVIINNYPSENPYAKDMLELALKLSTKHELKTILSLTGDELRHALHYRPYALVLTNEDLRAINIYYETEKEQLVALHEMLINDRIHMLFYQDHKALYAVTKNKMAKIILDHSVQNDKRMKDVLIGVLGVCVARQYEMEKTIRLMGAVIKVADFSNFPQICTRKQVNDQRNKMSLIELYNSRNGYLI